MQRTLAKVPLMLKRLLLIGVGILLFSLLSIGVGYQGNNSQHDVDVERRNELRENAPNIDGTVNATNTHKGLSLLQSTNSEETTNSARTHKDLSIPWDTNRGQSYGYKGVGLNASESMKFFNIKPQGTMTFPKPEYLPEARNPCFYTDISSLSHLSESERQRGQRLTCLPLVYFVGVSKAGTSDFHAKLVQHQHLIEGLHKEAHFWNLNKPKTTAWYRMGLYTEIYQYFASAIENCCISKNASCHVDQFTPTPGNGRVDKGMKNGLKNINEKIRTFGYEHLKEQIAQGYQCPLLTVDSTPRTIYDGINWELDKLNKGLDEPKILTADRIHHFVPNAKAILLLRDPIARTLSDFRFFGGGSQATRFHQVVVAGIKWWNTCLKTLSERRCAFGLYYRDKHLKDLPGDMSWGTNGAGRLRLSMYMIYIRKWLEVFPKENLLILNSKVLDEDPIGTLKDIVYPFLELEPLSERAEQNLKNLLNAGHIHVTKKRQFTPLNETVTLLEELFEPYNRELVELTGDQSFLWR